MSDMNQSAAPSPVSVKPAKKLHWGAWVAIAAGALLLLGLLATGGAFLYFNAQYNSAAASADKGDYHQAWEQIKPVPEFFKDTGDLKDYALAGTKLVSSKYSDAKEAFVALGSYRNAAVLVQECDYRMAAALLEEGKFDQAKGMFTALGAYQDAPAMINECDYRQASAHLDNGQFEQAAALFGALAEKEYRDAGTMVLETDYRQADSILQSGDYAKAELLLTPLVGKKYKDAEGLLNEAYYQRAQALLKSGRPDAAFPVLAKIKQYKDSQALLADVSKTLHDKAVGLYQDGDIGTAKPIFVQVEPYVTDAGKYLLLIEGLEMTVADSRKDYAKAKAIFDRLMAISDFDAANKAILSSRFLPFRLEGKWATANGNFTFEVKYDKAKKTWFVDGDEIDVWSQLDGGTFLFRNVFGQWLVRLEFRFLSEDTCEAVIYNAYGYDDGTVLRLTRS